MARDLPPRAPWQHRVQGTRAALTALVVIAALAGCAPEVGGTGSHEVGVDGSGAQASPEATGSPSPAALAPDGTAADNLLLFTEITQSVWASDQRAAGRAYVDALAAAGFDKTAMQVTDDLTTVGNPAESIEFSVLWGEQCLVGQVGPATGDPVTAVVPALTEGTCLVGETRPIDW